MENNFRVPNMGNEFYLISKGDHYVRAAQNSLIKNVLMIEQECTVVTTGEFLVAYGNLDTLYVRQGEKIKQGQIIGRIKKAETDSFPVFSLYIEKDGKGITDRSIFKR